MDNDRPGPPPKSTAAPALPIACSLTTPELAARAEQVRGEVFAHVLERRALPDGYAFRFPATGAWTERLAEFVALERECCRFLRFGLEFAPDLGPTWLTLSGGAGTRAFIEQTFLPSADGTSLHDWEEA